MRLGSTTFTLEQAFRAEVTGRAIWIGYGTYRSLSEAKAVAASRLRPCRIVAARVVWTSPGAPLET
jgi:hypothetical protein